MNSTTGKGISYAKNNILSTVTAIWDLNQFSDNVMMQSDTSCMTYGEFSEKSSDILVHIPKRSLVFNLCSNEIGAFIGYTSFLNGDIVQVMLPDTLDKTSLNTLIEIYHPTHLWMPDSLSKSYHVPFCLQSHFSLCPHSFTYILPDDLPDNTRHLFRTGIFMEIYRIL